MEIKERVKSTMLTAIRKAFSVEKEYLESNLNLNFFEDMKASSIQLFPIISALEDELDIEIQYQDFRRNGKTIAEAIEFVRNEYKKVYGE